MEEKDRVRKQILASRNALTIEDITNKSTLVIENLIPLLNNKKHIGCYSAIGSEVQLTTLYRTLLQQNKHLLFPKSSQKGYIFEAVTSLDDLTLGKYNVLEPKDTLHQSNSDKHKIDLFFVPGVAFDKSGNRLGYGKGYYDQLLHHTTGLKIGICFDCQVVDAIPNETHDIKMDIIVTESRIIQ